MNLKAQAFCLSHQVARFEKSERKYHRLQMKTLTAMRMTLTAGFRTILADEYLLILSDTPFTEIYGQVSA